MNPVTEPLLDLAEYKYSEEYLLVTAEINKLSSNNPDSVDWSTVYNNCCLILEKINDFVLAGYLIFACLKLKKNSEFENLLDYLSNLIKNYYNCSKAMPKKEHFKYNALEWLYERIKKEGIDFSDKQLTKTSIHSILSKIDQLDQVLLNNNIAFGFSSSCKALKKRSKLLEQEIAQKEVFIEESNNSTINHAEKIELQQEVFSENDLILKILKNNSDMIVEKGEVVADIVNINRSLTWHRVNDFDDDFYEAIKGVASVPVDQVYQAKYLIDQDEYMKAAVHLECLFCQYPLSLDIQYYLFVCADKLNNELLIESLVHNLKILINKYPKLIFSRLAESERCAGKRTIEWIKNKVLISSGTVNIEFNDIEALIRYYQGKLQEDLSAIDKIALYLERSWQLAKMNYFDMAISALEKIYKDLKQNPILVDLSNESTHYVRCISLLYQCYSEKLSIPNSELQEYQYEIYQGILENLSAYYPSVILVKEMSDE